MNIHNSYFSVKNPLLILDRWLNPWRHTQNIDYEGKQLSVYWTSRADTALRKRSQPLTAEMQIYFTCVVQKRVIFHEQTSLAIYPINDLLNISLRSVQADSCDPVEFAKHHPVAHELTSAAAKKLRPCKLEIDFKDDQWKGEFFI